VVLAEVLALVATVLSILALIKEIIIPFVFKSDVKLSCYKEDDLVSFEDSIPSNHKLLGPVALGESRKYYFYRINAFNSMTFFTSTANDLYARMITIEKDGKVLGKFNTMLMRWTTNNFYETLSRGERLFINLCTVVYDYDANDNEKRHLILPGHVGGLTYGLATGFPIDELTDGDYEYTIGLYGKSIKGELYKITISFQSINGEPDLRISCCKQSKVSDKEVTIKDCRGN
jgi:hypothetical protein